MSRKVLGLKRLSDAPELRLANKSFALNNSTMMKLSSKGSCVAILRSPALSLEPELPTSEDMVLQTASKFSSRRLCLTTDKVPLDWTQPYPTGKKVAPCLVDRSSEQLQFGCSAATVASTSALWGDCCAVKGNGRHRLWKQRLNLAGRSTPAQLLDPVQYSLHVTHFGHTQVLEEKRKPFLRRKAGGGRNSRWTKQRLQTSQPVTKRRGNQPERLQTEHYTWNLEACVKKLSEHHRVTNTEQAQSKGENKLQTTSQKCKLLWLSKATAREQTEHTDLKDLS